MIRRPIRDTVINLTTGLADRCHPQVAERHSAELARYARLCCACDALESFLGMRPRVDDDAFALLSARRAEVADQLARANLLAWEQEAVEGLYLAIPYLTHCSDKQPVWLVNRTAQQVTYLGRKLYAFASTDEGVDEYQTSGNAFADGIAGSAVLAPGERLQIEDYSMSFDGDFVSNRRVILLIGSQRSEWLTSISRLGGYLWDEELHGLHRLTPVGVQVGAEL